MTRTSRLKISTGTAVVTLLAVAALNSQSYTQSYARSQNQSQNNDKYALKSPSGIAFSDFRGYEDWADVSSARTDEILKVIVANPTMIKAFKAGVPGNGQSFPDGSMIVKLQWKHKKSTEAPFVVEVPDVFSQAFVMEKDSRRFPKAGAAGEHEFNMLPRP